MLCVIVVRRRRGAHESLAPNPRISRSGGHRLRTRPGPEPFSPATMDGWIGRREHERDHAPRRAAPGGRARPREAIRGVGPQRAAQLTRFGRRTVEDALYHLPFRYEDRRALRPLASLHVGEEATAAGKVAHVRESRGGRRRRAVLEVVLRDADGLLLLVWFHQLSYFQRRFAAGQRVVVHGRVEPPLGGGPPRLIHPEVEVLGTGEEVAPQIVPVYEKPTEMHVGAMRRMVQAAVTGFAE